MAIVATAVNWAVFVNVLLWHCPCWQSILDTLNINPYAVLGKQRDFALQCQLYFIILTPVCFDVTLNATLNSFICTKTFCCFEFVLLNAEPFSHY